MAADVAAGARCNKYAPHVAVSSGAGITARGNWTKVCNRSKRCETPASLGVNLARVDAAWGTGDEGSVSNLWSVVLHSQLDTR
jgi:hypothetical protein